MQFFGRDHQVEADLERIRRANLPPDKLIALEQEEEALKKKVKETKLTAGETFAMVIAALSIIGPYVLAILGVFLLFALIF